MLPSLSSQLALRLGCPGNLGTTYSTESLSACPVALTCQWGTPNTKNTDCQTATKATKNEKNRAALPH